MSTSRETASGASPRYYGLIDGDVIAFRAAAACQHVVEWPSGFVEPFARKQEGEAALEGMIQRLVDRFDLKDFEVHLSCPAEDNWRLGVDPTYKSNRKNSVRPLLLAHLRQYLRDNYAATSQPHLEADDTIGIALTDETHGDYTKVAIGKDKDFYTVPGLHFQLGNEKIEEISPMQAREFHYQQTLSGDAVDGYAGCPGIGKVRAAEIVKDPRKLKPRSSPLTRGINKGKVVTKWFDEGPCTIWEAVVSQYHKAGLGEEEAIKTARLANILQHGQYNFETHEVTLWVPGRE